MAPIVDFTNRWLDRGASFLDRGFEKILTPNFNPKVQDTLHELNRLNVGLIVVAFLFAEIHRNYSQVDKLWSVIPFVYAVIILSRSSTNGHAIPRLFLMTICIGIWAYRLTRRFAKMGGYNLWRPWLGEEDYRWPYIRKNNFWGLNTNKFVWTLFSFFFIAFYQILLIFSFSALPMLAVWQQTLSGVGGEITNVDWIHAVLCVSCVICEGCCDNDQKRFQNRKWESLEKGKVGNDGYGKKQSAIASMPSSSANGTGSPKPPTASAASTGSTTPQQRGSLLPRQQFPSFSFKGFSMRINSKDRAGKKTEDNGNGGKSLSSLPPAAAASASAAKKVAADSRRNRQEDDIEIFGFRTCNFFMFSRHPSWVFEQGFWLFIASFPLHFIVMANDFNLRSAVKANAGLFRTVMFGITLLIMLFQGSAVITEAISKGKYPLYNTYAANVPVYPIDSFNRFSAFVRASVLSVVNFFHIEHEECGNTFHSSWHAWKDSDAEVSRARKAGKVVAAAPDR